MVARNASGSVRSRRSASLIARSTCHSGEHEARSTSVETGSVTGMPATSQRCSRHRSVLRCARMPGRRRGALRGTTTSIGVSSEGRTRPHNVAALRWLSRASAPQLNTAAIHLPFRLTSGLPTTYMPRPRGCRRPVLIRCLIESGPRPPASNCALVTTPCCARAKSQIGPRAYGVLWGCIYPPSAPASRIRPPWAGVDAWGWRYLRSGRRARKSLVRESKPLRRFSPAKE